MSLITSKPLKEREKVIDRAGRLRGYRPPVLAPLYKTQEIGEGYKLIMIRGKMGIIKIDPTTERTDWLSGCHEVTKIFKGITNSYEFNFNVPTRVRIFKLHKHIPVNRMINDKMMRHYRNLRDESNTSK